MNIEKKLKKYRQFLCQEELSDRTIQIYMTQAERFLNCIGNKAITKKDTMAYKEYMYTLGLKVSTINLYIVAVNRYLVFAGYEKLVLKVEKVQRRQCPDNVISEGEYQQLLSFAQNNGYEKCYYIMRTLALTGIRISELSGFKIEVLKKGKFTVCNKRKTREVYLPPKLVSELSDYCGKQKIESGTIFMGNNGKAINRVTVYKMLIRMAQKAGVSKEKVHPHSFRHLFALTYMKKYSNVFELADILGHSSLETTRIYTTSSVEEKRNRINDLEL